MPVKQYTGFSYAGIDSSQFNIINVNIGSGLVSEPLVSDRKIKETIIRGKAKPYYHELDIAPKVFSLSFALTSPWEYTETVEGQPVQQNIIGDIVNWLCGHTYYQPFYFTEEPNRIYYALVVDNPEIVHNCASHGYINVTMRCNSPYAYGQVVTSDVINCTTSPTTFTFNNDGDMILRPVIEIVTNSAGDISIVNTSDENREFKLTNLANDETLYIDNENEIIETDIPLMYRYSNHNDKFLQLLPGENELLVTGSCTLQFKYQFIYR